MGTADNVRLTDFILWSYQNLVHPVSRRAWEWMTLESPGVDHWHFTSEAPLDALLCRVEDAGFGVIVL